MRATRTGALIAAALTLAPAALAAQATFEGTVAYTLNTPQGMTIDMVQHVKGDRMRAEMNTGMGNMVVLYDMKDSKFTMLLPAQKMYMTMDGQAVMDMAQQQAQTSADAKPTIRKTGEKETILGHECEHVEMTLDTRTVDYCATTDLGFYFGGSPPSASRGGNSQMARMSGEAQAMLRKEFPKGFFPLKITMKSDMGMMTMVATKVEKGSVSDDLFSVPDGYTEMAGMGRGRGGR